mmetsp:Transcript_36390/g.58443  ORF Transcript_36390/g.58443 Transcript_36390/m.58443 type:complete len:657 (+) Transcript_36390:321-2291(+)
MSSSEHVLGWRELRYTIGKSGWRKKGAARTILQGMSGRAEPGRLLGILGPSGSGKTTLLNILAGRVTPCKKKRGAALSGDVTYSGAPFHAGGRPDVSLAYIEQDPRFFSNLTVRETLNLDAALNGGSGGDVEAVIARLGLAQCADTFVGGDTGGGKVVAGISGGERRRLAIAAETLCLRHARCGDGTAAGEAAARGSGGIILADEPTTGLDSHQADKIVDVLGKTAREESAVVVCVLHQPRSAIFEKLDDLMLLASGGRVAYIGPASQALAHFSALGHTCPQYYNPAEFLIDLVAVDADGGPEAEHEDNRRVDEIVRAWAETSAAIEMAAEPPAATAGTALQPQTNRKARFQQGATRQFKLLVGRAWKQTRREMWVNTVRLAASAGLALAFGGCNYQVGFGPKSVKKRGAVLFQACINTSFLALCRSVNGFPRERATVAREMSRKRGGYRPGPYFFSKLLVETPVDMVFPVVFGLVMGPMVGLSKKGTGWLLTTLALQTASASCLGLSVGALSPSADIALAVGPCLMVLSIMLGDTTGAFGEVPDSLRGVSNASLIKWAFQGVLCSEFEGLNFDSGFDFSAQGNKAIKGTGGGAKGIAAAAAKRAMEGVTPRTGEEVLEAMGLPVVGGAKSAAKAQVNVALANALLTYVVLRLKGA